MAFSVIWGNAYTMDEFCARERERERERDNEREKLLTFSLFLLPGLGILRSLKTSRSGANK